MYFITEKTTKTGIKFSSLELKIKEVQLAQKKFASEIGVEQYRQANLVAYGGISSVIFKEKPNVKVWRSVYKDEYMPKANSKEGKVLLSKIKSLPIVSRDELNKCIGFDGGIVYRIGFAMNNKNYYGFEVGEDWGVKIPKDCKEVTYTEYKKMFK